MFNKKISSLSVIGITACTLATFTPAMSAHADSTQQVNPQVVASMEQSLGYESVNSNNSSFLTLNASDKTANLSTFSNDEGSPFFASSKPADGLIPIHVLYKSTTNDYLYVPETNHEYTSAQNFGYVDQGVKFYAPTTDTAGLVPMYRLQKNYYHTYTTSVDEYNKFISNGWTPEGARFFVAPASNAEEPDSGSLPVGQAAYPVPDGAVFVSSTNGSDTNDGSADAPFQTVAKALSVVPDGGTIVLHGGTYHEELGYISKKVTIQNAPNEAVWFDGSQVLSGFSGSSNSSTWSTDYSYNFNSGPTFTKDQPDSTQTNWNFVNPNEPMAAHPDQVWIDGVAQKQVANVSDVTAGTFYVDTTNKKLVLGTNPAGHDVRASTMQQAMRIGGDGTVLRGFGVKNYANTQYMMGSVVSYANNATIENVEIDNAATSGLGVYRIGNTLNNVTVDSAGMSGILGNNADGLVMNRIKVTNSNTEKFNFAPAAAGVKISRTDGLTLTNSDVENNYSTGIWTDEDTRDINIANNTFTNNARNGIMIELGARAKIVGNKMYNNGTSGLESILISDTNKAQIWNNVVNGPRAAIRMSQDNRTRANQPGVGDKRVTPDSDMNWQTMNTVINNNILEDDGAGTATLPEGRGNVSNWGVVHAQNYSGATNNQMVASENGNVFVRQNESTPKFVAVVQPNGATFQGYSTWGAYRAAYPAYDSTSVYKAGDVFASDGKTLVNGATNGASGVAQPSDIASLDNTTTGSTTIGA